MGIFRGYFSVRRHYNINVCYKNIKEKQLEQFAAIEKGNCQRYIQDMPEIPTSIALGKGIQIEKVGQNVAGEGA